MVTKLNQISPRERRSTGMNSDDGDLQFANSKIHISSPRSCEKLTFSHENIDLKGIPFLISTLNI